MPEIRTIEAVGAPLPLSNLDTDQIMPKQFLRIIDKAGLDKGLLYDMRFDGQGRPRADFVLNRPRYRDAGILVTGPNFGCGSSREHAVWGLQQYGIRAVIAPSFGEIFYSNAMNNQLLLVMLPQGDVDALMRLVSGDAGDDEADRDRAATIRIDLEAMTVNAGTPDGPDSYRGHFTLSERHRSMFRQGLDVIGLTLTHRAAIDAFARAHHRDNPWLQDVAGKTMRRLAAA